jgi:uncharacterized protein (TIRG00374 family)
MKRRWLTWLQYLLFSGGGLFLVWWQLKSMSPVEKNEFYRAIGQTNFWIIIPVVCMSLASHLSRAMRWKLLLEPVGYKPSTANAFMATMIGYLANSAVPRLGEVLKCSMLARYEKMRIDKLVGTILLERSFDLICFALFVGLTITFQLDLIGSTLNNFWETALQKTENFSWTLLIVVLTALALMFILLRIALKKLSKLNIVQKLNQIISGITDGFKSILQLKNRKAFLLHTLFIWAMYLGQIYVGFSSLNETSELSLGAACSVLTLASLSMIVTPGGIGSFPIFVMEVLLLYQIESPIGKAFGWLMWGVSTGLIVVSGLLSLVIIPWFNRNRNEMSEQ